MQNSHRYSRTALQTLSVYLTKFICIPKLAYLHPKEY